MKLLLVGDPHVTVEELGDAQALIDGVLSLCAKLRPDGVVFLGDLHHNHALVRVEVTDFWLRNLAKFETTVYLLVGNHDRPNDASSKAHALQVYSHLATVVDSAVPVSVSDKSVVLAPYYHDNSVMVEEIQRIRRSSGPIDTLICHQTFDGSVYENGFYAPDGVDPVLIGVPQVYSGHIHTAQKLEWPGGRIYYVGSPRWRTVSDANEYKTVALLDTQSNSVGLIPTDTWCSPISKATISTMESFDTVPFMNNPRARFNLDLVGSKASLEDLSREARQRFPNAKIRPVATDTSNKQNRVSESEGVYVALKRFVSNHKPPFGTNPKVLHDMVAQRLTT